MLGLASNCCILAPTEYLPTKEQDKCLATEEKAVEPGF